MFSSNSNFFALINKDINSAHCGIMETGFTRKEKGKLISEITRTYNNLSYMNNAGFDSTGRYIFTSSQKTNSYQLWTAFGDQIFKDTVSDLSGLTNIVWRPRLTGLLDEKKTAEIEANLKNYKKNYEEEDSKITNFKEWENKERRERMKKEVSFIHSSSLILTLFVTTNLFGFSFTTLLESSTLFINRLFIFCKFHSSSNTWLLRDKIGRKPDKNVSKS